MKETKRSKQSPSRIPYPEITCPNCSGRMNFHECRPLGIVPYCTTLRCESCGDQEEIYFYKSKTRRVEQ